MVVREEEHLEESTNKRSCGNLALDKQLARRGGDTFILILPAAKPAGQSGALLNDVCIFLFLGISSPEKYRPYVIFFILLLHQSSNNEHKEQNIHGNIIWR